MIYLAYGSNMLTERLQRRVPSARPIGRARLPGMGLRFHKRSTDDSAKASLVPTPDGGGAWGVGFEMDEAELGALDAAEGRGLGYARQRLSVELDGDARAAVVYTARSAYIDDDLVPYGWYRALVIAGARQHALPERYVSTIRAVPTRRDPNTGRRTENAILLRKAGFGPLLDANS